MAGKKRKASEATCECFEAHETNAECDTQAFLDKRQELVKKHRAITAQVILYSETVEIFAGTEQKQTFIVHKDLLALHSQYFINLFSEKGPGVDKKITISVEPTLFADFVSWIYFGEFLQVENEALGGGEVVDDLWELGRFFRAPAFQNFCMDNYRNYCKGSETNANQPWPFIEGIKKMYSITLGGSLLRKLAVDSLSYKNPLQENKKGTPAWKEWKSLLTGQISEELWVKDLQDDFALEVGKDWKGIPPWDDQHRDNYMEKEILFRGKETTLEERWEKQILAARSKEDIKRAALAKTDVRSIIEWAHIQRAKD